MEFVIRLMGLLAVPEHSVLFFALRSSDLRSVGGPGGPKAGPLPGFLRWPFAGISKELNESRVMFKIIP